MTPSRTIPAALLVLLLALALPVAAAPDPGLVGDAAPDPAPASDDVRVPARLLAKGMAPGDEAVYIIELEAKALSRYEGGYDDLPATNPAANDEVKVDLDSPASQAYLRFLDGQLDDLLARMERIAGRDVEVLYRYRLAFAGMAAVVTAEEAARIAALDGVLHVEINRNQPILTDIGPGWIGAPGIWDGSDVPSGEGSMGEGVLVGILDTGINMDHPSFAATDETGYTHVNPRGAGNYAGWCDPSYPEYDASLVCNDKLIGVYSFPDAGMSPEDDNGHGSHTASTVAGNRIAAVPQGTFTTTISGVAPHANIIAYDVCLDGGCPTSATIAAVERTVEDQVDVLNYSIGSGIASPWFAARQHAFLGANAAGVFPALSAGNSGPGAATTAAGAPWVAAVAASQHGRTVEGEKQLIDMSGGDTAAPADMDGAGTTAGYGPAPIVLAQGVTNDDGVPDDGQCLTTFPAGTWNGEIVLCDRGQIARVDKGSNVLAGGAGGLILANVQGGATSVNDDYHYLPAIHVDADDGDLLRAWLATGEGQEGRITETSPAVDTALADITAGFSSRGPARLDRCCRRDGLTGIPDWHDLVKPDITAPGVNVLAAYNTPADGGDGNPEYGIISGTSMSSPHTAGAAALLRGVYPDWSASRIKSALMLTANTEQTRKEDGSTPADPFDVGSGRVDLSVAARAGFVLDETAADYEAADPDQGGDPKALNLASLGNAYCLGTCAWARTLTSVADGDVEWTASIQPIYGASDLPADLSATVSPETFTLAAGADQEITVNVDVTGATMDQWLFAQVVFEAAGDAAPMAHMPIAVRPSAAKFVGAVTIRTDQVMGTRAITDVRTLGASELSIVSFGLAEGARATGQVPPDPRPAGQRSPYSMLTATHQIDLTVTDGARRLVAEITDSSAPDMDLFVGRDLNGDGIPQQNEQVCLSGNQEYLELCDVDDPQAGEWWVLLFNYEGSGAAEDDVTAYTGVVYTEDAGNFTASGPAAPPDDQPFDLDLSWDLPTLQPDDHWYGLVGLGPDASAPEGFGTIYVDLIGIGDAQETPTPTTEPPTATPEAPTETPEPTDPPTATPVPATATPEPPDMCICPGLVGRVPQAVIDAAVANPSGVGGYQQPRNPALPIGPFNPPRECLSLQNKNVPFHPLFNSLIFRASCQ